MKWLKYVSQKDQINIRHACNGGEASFTMNGQTYKVDGYYEETKTIFHFKDATFMDVNNVLTS